jgi:cation transporter-like permease
MSVVLGTQGTPKRLRSTSNAAMTSSERFGASFLSFVTSSVRWTGQVAVHSGTAHRNACAWRTRVAGGLSYGATAARGVAGTRPASMGRSRVRLRRRVLSATASTGPRAEHSNDTLRPLPDGLWQDSRSPSAETGDSLLKARVADREACVATIMGPGCVPAGGVWTDTTSRREAVTVPLGYTVRECKGLLWQLHRVHDTAPVPDPATVNGTVRDSNSQAPGSLQLPITAAMQVRNQSAPVLDALYVLDPCTSGLVGFLSLEDLLLAADDEQKIDQFVRQCSVVLSVDEEFEAAVRRLRNVGALTAPVVDREMRLVGLVTAADIIREMELEATDDILRFGGVESPLQRDDIESYFQTSTRSFVIGRSAWLVALLLLQSLSSIVLGQYSALIERHVVLALFLTMMVGAGGNAGNQSSALVIRGLATGEISPANAGRVIRRELLVGCAIATILSAVGFTRVYIGGGDFLACVTVSTSLWITVFTAVLIGTIAPLILAQMGLDPCHCASPLLSTLTDIGGVLALCLVGSIILGSL